MERCRTGEYADKVYRTCLWLYPIRFRRRFGRQMACVFHECCYERMQLEGSIGCAKLWLHTLKDLLISAGHERARELVRSFDIDRPIFAIIDSTLIPSIIVSNLIVLGMVTTILFLRVTPGHVSSG